MKKLITILLTLAMATSLSHATYAADSMNSSAINTVDEFSAIEYTDDNHQIVRIYSQIPTLSTTCYRLSEQVNHHTTRTILAQLGMDEFFINQLTDEQLDEYANAKSFVSISSYIKTDAEGNISYVSKSDATNSAYAINDRIDQIIFDGNGDLDSASASYSDEYLHIYLLIIYKGDGTYKFSTDAEWLTLPYFRGNDSLGICAQDISIINSSRSGWISTTCEYDTMLGSSSETQKNTFTASDMQNVTNGVWDGSAALFNLPNNFVDVEFQQIYSEIKVHYEFNARVRYPSLESYFNASATYSHTELGLAFSPSVSIDSNGPSASIGIDAITLKDDCAAELSEPMHYIPD